MLKTIKDPIKRNKEMKIFITGLFENNGIK